RRSSSPCGGPSSPPTCEPDLALLSSRLLVHGRPTSRGGRCLGGHLLLTCLLLPRNGLLRALAGAGVGLGALAVHGQAAAVPDALVAPDLDLAADVGRHLAAQITLDLVVALDVVAQLHDVVVGEVAGAQVSAEARRLECLLGAGASHAVDVGE